MGFHDELLDAARGILRPDSGRSPSAAVLRRGVSTAYYAVFHLLIHEAMARIILDPEIRADLGRAINHELTRKICQQYADAEEKGGRLTLRLGEEIPERLRDFGSTFVRLIEARHRADYDPRPEQDFSPVLAEALLSLAETAFADWHVIQDEPATLKFLTRIFLESLTRRKG